MLFNQEMDYLSQDNVISENILSQYDDNFAQAVVLEKYKNDGSLMNIEPNSELTGKFCFIIHILNIYWSRRYTRTLHD